MPEGAPPEETPPEGAPPEHEAFDAWPGDPELLPPVTQVSAQLETLGLQQAAADAAAQVHHKTDVAAKTLAAGRTGSELGALYVEAGVADPTQLAERALRIQAGLDTLYPESEAVQSMATFAAFLAHEPDRERILGQLDEMHDQLLPTLEPLSDDKHLPLILAGAWMQAYQLLCVAMEQTGELAGARELFYKPVVGDYFVRWLEQSGDTALDAATAAPVMKELKELRALAMKSEMTLEDVRATREGLEGILGMM